MTSIEIDNQNRGRRVWTWLLSGAAFVIGIALSGCSSMFSGRSPVAAAPTTQETALSQADPANSPVFQVAADEPTPPKVNIFGEFDGVQRPAAKSVGEAGFQQHTYVDEGYDGEVSVDPKGQWLVFASTRNSVHPNIYLQKVDGLSVIELTSEECDNAFPVFSPDGKKIAYCSTRGGNWDIYVMDVDGKNTVQVTSSPMQELHPSFSPDGTRLVYSAMSSRSGQWELWTVNLTSNEKRMIGFGLFPSWSPNKQKDQIAFQKPRARGSRWFSLWTLDLVDGEARQITEVAASTNAAIVSPSWRSDGKMLSFATIVDPNRGENGRTVGQQDIWTINLDGTNRHRITDGNGICATPFWASDNRIYFVSDRSGVEAIWSARADESSLSNSATAATDTKEVTR